MTACRRTPQALLLLVSFFMLIGCKEPMPEHNYIKDGVALSLPAQWEVFEDFNDSENHRLISIATQIVSSVSINVYRPTDDANAPPTLEQVLSQYMQVLLPPETEGSASIDHGEAERSGIKGRFVDATLGEPYNQRFFVEIYPRRSGDMTSYIIFNTPTARLEEISPHIDRFITSIKLN